MKSPYSLTELAEFKGILDAKLAEAQADLELLTAALDREPTKKPEAPIGDPAFTQPGEEVTRDECEQLRKRQQKFIQHLKDAQVRITNGTYGVCRVTGQPISKERLRLVPHATLAIAALPVENKN